MPDVSRLLLPGGPQPTAALGPVVRERRRALGLSQERLAERAGLDRTYVSGIETGRRDPTLRVVLRLADALGRPPADLLGGV